MCIALIAKSDKAGMTAKTWITHINERTGTLFTWFGSRGWRLQLRTTDNCTLAAMIRRADVKKSNGYWEAEFLPSNNLGANEILQLELTPDSGYFTVMGEIKHHLKKESVAEVNEVEKLFNVEKTKYVLCSLHNLHLLSYLVYFKRELPEAITIRNLEGENLTAEYLWQSLKEVKDTGKQADYYRDSRLRFIKKNVVPAPVSLQFSDIANSQIKPFCF